MADNNYNDEYGFKPYRRIGYVEMRMVQAQDVVDGLPDNVSVSPEDAKNGHPRIGDMIARNPNNHDDQWLVTEEYFKENFEPDF